MRYVPVHVSFLRSSPGVLADDATIGVVTRLLAYAAEHELGDTSLEASSSDLCEVRITGCRRWTKSQWFAAVNSNGVDKAIAAGLARWDRYDLLVAGYDIKLQKSYEHHRECGKKGGRPRRVKVTASVNVDVEVTR